MKTLRVLTGIVLSLVFAGHMSAQIRPADPNHLRIAEDYFRTNTAAYGLLDSSQDLKARKSYADERGVTHIRYDQYYKGIRVFEGEAIAHIDSQSGVTVTNAIHGNINLNTSPGVSAAAAVSSAVAALKLRGPYETSQPALMILPRGERSPVDLLVWNLRLFVFNTIDSTARWEAFVDARNGSFLWAYNSLETGFATSAGQTMYSGNVVLSTDYQPIGSLPFVAPRWQLRDMRRNGSSTLDMHNLMQSIGVIMETFASNTFGNGLKDNSDRTTAGADAQFAIEATWDYFKTQHGRLGVDGQGSGMSAGVHWGVNFQNAFWDSGSQSAFFGDGGPQMYPLVSLDIVGHEFSHGVMEHEANLTYVGESGGLNEANSDIFGTMVEYSVNSAIDKPDYWMGERAWKANWSNGIYTQIGAARYMDDPHKDGISPACWSPGIGNSDVHNASGPANHMFYLLAEGGQSKCNGINVVGIGRAAAAQIWYSAVRDHMTANTNYKDARGACLLAAEQLYGPGSVQYNLVKVAFSAINVN
jgi:Zn-dependent metalloprotease